MSEPQITIADVTSGVAYLDMSWPGDVDPPYVRVRLMAYDGDHLVWIGRAFGVLYCVDLASGELQTPNATYQLPPAIIKALEGQVR